MITDGAGAAKAGAGGAGSVPAEWARTKLVKEWSTEAEPETPGAEKPLPLDPGDSEAIAEKGAASTGAGGAGAGSTVFVEKSWVNSPAGRGWLALEAIGLSAGGCNLSIGGWGGAATGTGRAGTFSGAGWGGAGSESFSCRNNCVNPPGAGAAAAGRAGGTGAAEAAGAGANATG